MAKMEVIEAAASAAHEANRVYCLSIGDTSQPKWENAPDWQKNSAYAGVRAVLDKPSMTPAEQHESWMALKIKEGWVYGMEKNADAKIHPCLVPYEELPAAQRLKDSMFGSVVRAVLKAHNEI